MLLAVSLQLFDIYFLWKSFLYHFLKLFLLEGAVITFFVLNVNLLLSPLPDALNSANWGIFIFVWYFVSHYWFEPMSIATNNWASYHSTKSMSCYHMTDKYLSSSSHEPFSHDVRPCVLCPVPLSTLQHLHTYSLHPRLSLFDHLKCHFTDDGLQPLIQQLWRRVGPVNCFNSNQLLLHTRERNSLLLLEPVLFTILVWVEGDRRCVAAGCDVKSNSLIAARQWCVSTWRC